MKTQVFLLSLLLFSTFAYTQTDFVKDEYKVIGIDQLVEKILKKRATGNIILFYKDYNSPYAVGVIREYYSVKSLSWRNQFPPIFEGVVNGQQVNKPLNDICGGRSFQNYTVYFKPDNGQASINPTTVTTGNDWTEFNYSYTLINSEAMIGLEEIKIKGDKIVLDDNYRVENVADLITTLEAAINMEKELTFEVLSDEIQLKIKDKIKWRGKKLK